MIEIAAIPSSADRMHERAAYHEGHAAGRNYWDVPPTENPYIEGTLLAAEWGLGYTAGKREVTGR
jgi:hypothetical protein